MGRSDMIKAAGAAAGTLAVAATSSALTSSPAEAQLVGGPNDNAVVNITPPDTHKFISGRFAGKTFIVTGSALCMGAAAARRLAREGANVVGVDWLDELGVVTAENIRKEGGKSVFVHSKYW